MSPHPSITAPPQPLLPRQTIDPNDPYGISSMMASLSEAYPELYSDYTYSSYSYDEDYYSSLMSEYESLTAAYSFTDYTSPTDIATGAATTRSGSLPTTTGASRATTAPVSSPDSNGNSGGGSGGLSSGAKIGIGVGVTLGLLLLAGVGIFIWCMGKNKGKKTSTTVIAPVQPAFATQQQQQQQQPPPPQQFHQPQPQMGYVNNQGYMQGYPQQSMSPPPQYVQPPQSTQQQNMAGAYGAYAKGPDPNVVELEQEYHFAKPGFVEMGDGVAEPEQPQKGKK